MSRFVSAGTDEEPTERDEAWAKAQQELDAKRAHAAEIGKQEGGKSLYETLQANKAAKQEAFEESIRLKNQFRSLDEDEVEFLDSVLESTRAQEAEVRKQTAEELDSFRRQQEEAGRVVIEQEDTEPVEAEAWTSGPRKRRRAREPAVGGIKLRRTSTAEKKPDHQTATDRSDLSTAKSPVVKPIKDDQSLSIATTEALPRKDLPKASMSPSSSSPSAPAASPSPSTGTGLGLGAYSSDEED